MKIISDQASVETANDYTKRNFVFWLHAPDGSEFLFGADSEEQQEEWVSQLLSMFLDALASLRSKLRLSD